MTSLLTDTPLPDSLSPGHLNLLLCEAKESSGQRSQHKHWFCHFQAVRLSWASCFNYLKSCSPSRPGPALCSDFRTPVSGSHNYEGEGLCHLTHGRQGPPDTEGHSPGPRTSKWTDGDPNMGQLTLTPAPPALPRASVCSSVKQGVGMIVFPALPFYDLMFTRDWVRFQMTSEI